jgi:predicted TIM-barrel fold metal-dependent hydrolase
MPSDTDSSTGKPSGPYRRGKLLRRVVPYAKAARDLARPGPRLRHYEPVSNLVGDEHLPSSAVCPAIDFHTHLGRWLSPDGDWMQKDKRRLLGQMDALNIAMLVNLDGRWGDDLEDNLDRYDRAHPDRFVTFCQVDLDVLDTGGGPDAIVRSLESSKRAGAKGLKIWKNLGLLVHVGGRCLMPDDRLLEPVWEAAGALALPVLVHVADPVAFFQPMNRHNERLEELMAHPSISLARHGMDHRERIIRSFEAVVAGHSKTQFIGAHVGCNAENLPWVSRMLSEYPNFWIDTAARSELGRQPRASARMIRENPDKVLFGTDVFPIDPEAYRIFFRLLETEDEYFGYTPGDGPSVQQGRWTVSGLGLGHELIEKVYRLNAMRLLGLESTDVTGARAIPPEAAES